MKFKIIVAMLMLVFIGIVIGYNLPGSIADEYTSDTEIQRLANIVNEAIELDKFKGMCSEIDEICEDDFRDLCELSLYEIVDLNTLCEIQFENMCEDADCYCNDDYKPKIS